MPRPTCIKIDTAALAHNLAEVKRYAKDRAVIAMVKANAYGCGLAAVVSALEKDIAIFGVACMDEALAIRALGIRRDCLLLQGVFSPEEYRVAVKQNFQCVVHQASQLRWLLDNRLENRIRIWLKVNTGMNRLGFLPHEVYEVAAALQSCPWVDGNIGLMTHLACADEPQHPDNQHQIQRFFDLDLPAMTFTRSIANSGAIMAIPDAHADMVRPGIMLYGVSPWPHQTGQQLGLKPVMQFLSAISAIHHCPAGVSIGYGRAFVTRQPSVIGIIPVGYGDGYPRHIATNTPVWVNGRLAPIVGRVSMDMLSIDLTGHPGAAAGDVVELWGQNLAVETIAHCAGTIAYELLCQYKPRVKECG